MSSYKPMADGDKPAFSDKMFACPNKGHWLSFQLVDEFGEAKPYAGLAYNLQDSAKYLGLVLRQLKNGLCTMHDGHSCRMHDQ